MAILVIRASARNPEEMVSEMADSMRLFSSASLLDLDVVRSLQLGLKPPLENLDVSGLALHRAHVTHIEMNLLDNLRKEPKSD